jgi:hypothetical protein
MPGLPGIPGLPGKAAVRVPTEPREPMTGLCRDASRRQRFNCAPRNPSQPSNEAYSDVLLQAARRVQAPTAPSIRKRMASSLAS